MIKSDLVKRLARQFPGIRNEDARIMIDLFLAAMKEGLKSAGGNSMGVRFPLRAPTNKPF